MVRSLKKKIQDRNTRRRDESMEEYRARKLLLFTEQQVSRSVSSLEAARSEEVAQCGPTLGNQIIDSMIRFTNEVDTWEKYRELMFLFLNGDLQAHFVHFGPLSEDFHEYKEVLKNLNSIGRWISVNGQPALDCDLHRSSNPVLLVQRPYICAYIPTEQIGGLMHFCATNNLFITVAAAITFHMDTEGENWLTRNKYLMDSEFSLLQQKPYLAQKILKPIDTHTTIPSFGYNIKEYINTLPPKLAFNTNEHGKYVYVEIWSHNTRLHLLNLLFEGFIIS